MKNKLTALALLTVTACSLAPTPARANDNGLALAGGFLGGLIVASAINDHHDNYTPAYVAPYAPSYDYRGNDGCWENVSVQVFVPGCWVAERGYRGQIVRRYVPPHHEYRTNRVWVVTNRDYRSDRYDRNNRSDRNDNRDHDFRGRSHR